MATEGDNLSINNAPASEPDMHSNFSNHFAAARANRAAVVAATPVVEAPAAAPVEPKGEPCGKCKGSGKFIGYTGRVVGNCFGCGGKGFLSLSTAEVEAAREYEADQWAADHAEVVQWLRDAAPTFDFAASLLESLNKWGKLTDGQLAAAERCAARDMQRGKTSAQPKAVGNAFAAKNLHEVMQRHTTFRADRLRLSRRNQDQLVWIKFGEDLVGKIDNGLVVLFKAADPNRDAIVALIREFDANPIGAAMKYGKLSGTCCSCGRDLTDPESIELGIGPVCRGRFNA